MNLQEIKNMMDKSEEIFGEENQIKAVKQNGFAIQYIHNPSKAVMLEAVKQDGNAIRYIHNPSEAAMLEAVKQNGNAIQYFKKAWFKDLPEELTIAEIEEKLGYKIKIVGDLK